MLDIDNYDTSDAKEDFSAFFYNNNDQIFLSTLISFIKKHKNGFSPDDIKQFINTNKEDLSKIKDGIENLLIGFTNMCVLNNSQNINGFLGLASEFQIEDVACIRLGIIERVKDETRGAGKDRRKITDFFQTPKDLLSFYVKAHPEFSVTIIDVADRHRMASISGNCIGDESCFDIFDLLEKYGSETIANFTKSDQIDNDSESEYVNMLIWASFFNSAIPWKLKEIFPTIKDLIDFYTYKVSDLLKQNKNFSIFCFLYWWAYTDQGAATGEWDDYLKEVSKDKNHISLFFNFFEGKMSFDKQDIKNIVLIYKMFSKFQSIQGFFDFYLEIYSAHSDYLKNENSKRDHILNTIISTYCEKITNFLLTNGNEEKYKFFMLYSINSVCELQDLHISDFYNIVNFLQRNADLDKSLKDRLLNKINNDIVKKMDSVKAIYSGTTCEYRKDFETNLSYVQKIMSSKDILFETKKKIYEWAKNALEEDQKQWNCVLKMCVCNIESKKKNDLNFYEKDNQYEYLSKCKLQNYKNLKNLNSYKKNERYLADLNNLSNDSQFKDLNTREKTIQNQIDTLQNKLDKTKFKLGWILIVWFSGIGTIILLALRYYWNSSKINLDATKSRLPTAKQNLENTINESCQKKKTDYENSLSEATEQMKKWGGVPEAYKNHEKYCQLLEQIIDIDKQQNIPTHDNESNNLIPL